MVRPAGVRTSRVVLEQKMYVGPWQEYRALARARHAEALYATRGPETQVADELERLRRALELVSGELPADKIYVGDAVPGGTPSVGVPVVGGADDALSLGGAGGRFGRGALMALPSSSSVSFSFASFAK